MSELTEEDLLDTVQSAGTRADRASPTGAPRAAIRVDLKLIADMIEPGSRVLDIGCGEGALLDYLVHEMQVDGRGIEISQTGVNACVKHGLSVIQGDADTDLKDYPDGAFDYVVLSQTLQATREPRAVLSHLLRIGRRAIVSFPNFGFWRVRWELGWRGRMPVGGALQYEWFDTPNIHLCTIRDFVNLCDLMDLHIERGLALDAAGKELPIRSLRLSNLLGQQAVFLLRKAGTPALDGDAPPLHAPNPHSPPR